MIFAALKYMNLIIIPKAYNSNINQFLGSYLLLYAGDPALILEPAFNRENTVFAVSVASS